MKFQEGLKFDTGKDPWHLAPWDAFRAIIKVLDFGAKKYEARNWEKGMAWSRPYGAMIRHLAAWWEGEAKDPETGFSHLWHAGCCWAFLTAYELRGIGTDDRPTKVDVVAGGPVSDNARGTDSVSGSATSLSLAGYNGQSGPECKDYPDFHPDLGC